MVIIIKSDAMYPKFIIAGNAATGRGYLRMGTVINHKDLRIGYEKIWGGGWWARNDETRTIILYGSSGDFGHPDFSHLASAPRELRDYTFIYSESLSGQGRILDMDGVEWV